MTWSEGVLDLASALDLFEDAVRTVLTAGASELLASRPVACRA